ncbi:phosphotransferase [Bifidobacterium aerophilum]|uniref:phosphotransferase n=1 Tax=Bifidobacterium aerophilum TaxID=1798155 RepID=UPI001EF7826B|nr:phosphotransferase [Bifidobacterium aerophilum]
MPGITVAGVRGAGPSNAADSAAGIDQAIVLDATGRQYDVFASGTEAGRKRLQGRVRAARVLAEAREPGGLGFALDQVVAFQKGEDGKGPTGDIAVMVINHLDGVARNLDLLTLDDCSAMGTAIGAIHRLPGTMVQTGGYPAFGTSQIHAQLTGWIRRLRSAGHIPSEITGSWERIIATDGLWSFGTCFVHGGFVDGDVLYSGSTITAVTNWQGMQVNDPARDLAWIFAKLDEEHRNAVLSSYGRMMGSRLDDLIMLRANLWLQMEQVGDFIQALNRADNVKIMQFKAQVDRLAHQLGVATHKAASAPAPAAAAASGRPAAAGSSSGSAADAQERRSPSTITVGTLLRDSERRLAQANAQAGTRANTQAPASSRPSTAVPSDATGDMDRTGSAEIVSDRTSDRTPGHVSDATSDRTPTSVPAAASSPSSSQTMAISPDEARAMFAAEPSDDTPEGQPQAYRSQPYQDLVHQAQGPTQQEQDAQTVLIPLLEQEERALRDAQLGLASRTGITRTVAPDAHQNTASQTAQADDDDDTGETTPKA